MHYHVSRNGQTYGPYTLEDLQRYVASGNVLPTDLAKTDEMPEWLPVSQILGEQAAAAPSPAFATPGYASPAYVDPAYNQPAALAGSPYPDAPNLHWGLYWLFSWLTCTLFSKVMTLVQAAWLKRVQPNSMAIISYAAQYGILIMSIIVRSLTHTVVQVDSMNGNFSFHTFAHQNPFVSLLNLLYFIMIFVSRFIMRASLEEHFNTVEPVGLRLNPVMTFFFGGIYFQYHLNKINAMKQAARFGAQRPY